ncbi:phosphoribosyl-ATP diphosphatase [Engelhardtia mirabilis]|uniref:Histidine biosynthesis bifunctional protein HisIE n=1 Tax=Engelhardtia mirabilis TaxID=2528011 RepID=A0A518BI16_9BACT|nr:1-(5-phosphoribosyl)-5-[(5-phosphoribosylamino)methylideneamino] imidazole-4-carboxamide isomerase [Planctomycetes bacterium Pla133]QDV00947.1 1-(5-phosphoribosyl)-5-[(5-phosphoribosylamino)methylideneamino] imidazole-4-carboxamide isomerase [Planctomycetes bacterium Pla86]
MIVPSIDLQGGQAVQLIGGAVLELEAGDPRPLMQRFARVGPVAVVDLDAALGAGENTALIDELVDLGPVRVGGGIRSVEAARRWLDRGAEQVVVGTAATPQFLGQLPRERVIAALDARNGEVVVEGWTVGTGSRVAERMAELAPFVSGFLVTVVEREGRLGGVDETLARSLRAAAGDRSLTYAGGVTTPADVAVLDRLGIDAQVGMALYTGRLDLAEGFTAPLSSDRPDGLWPTVVCDETGRALGLAYSDLQSVRAAIDGGVGAYHSRRRGLWVKGASSGDTQELLRVEVDCDRDALRFIVRQTGAGFCHRGTATCFGDATGLAALETTLRQRRASAPDGSYTARLFDDPALLDAKLREEVEELIAAEGRDEVVQEAADVLFFTLTKLRAAGVPLADVERALDARALRVSRRPGDAKPNRTGAER